MRLVYFASSHAVCLVAPQVGESVVADWVGLLVLLLVIGWIIYLILTYLGILSRVTDYTDKTPDDDGP